MSSYLRDAVWVEKYRPKSIDELVLSKEHTDLFHRFVKEKHFPNLLLYGGVGSGKTAVGLILCKLGVSLELNSSDDRGINIMRNKVKPFIFAHSEELRIVLLDEFDDATIESKRALKRMIEHGVGNARFILTANEVHRVIPALRSRCTCLEFAPPSKEYVVEYLDEILEEEDIESDEEELETLVDDCYPDIRKCVNTLQLNCHAGKLAYSFFQATISELNFVKLFSEIKAGNVEGIRETVIEGNPDYALVYQRMVELVLVDNDFKNVKKEALPLIAEYYYRDSAVADREMIFSACCIELGNLLEG